MSDFPLHRFEEYGRLTATEREAVGGLSDTPHTVRKGRVIQHEDAQVTGFFILLSGWAAAATSLPDGGRQILKVHLPGDALGTTSMPMQKATEALVALTDVEVAHVPLERFGRLFEDHPRIAARFLLSVQQERIALMDRLASIGRTSSEARVAAFLLDMMERLRPLGLVRDAGFRMLLTQEQIGDVLSLTNVHVNRVLANLTGSGLIERDGKRVRLIDVDALSQLGARPARHPFVDQTWLPAAR